MARLLPPESAALDGAARAVGIGSGTLERWRDDARSMPARARTPTAAARVEAVVTTAPMDEAGRSAWCRGHGVFVAELDKRRANCSAALAGTAALLVRGCTRPARSPASTCAPGSAGRLSKGSSRAKAGRWPCAGTGQVQPPARRRDRRLSPGRGRPPPVKACCANAPRPKDPSHDQSLAVPLDCRDCRLHRGWRRTSCRQPRTASYFGRWSAHSLLPSGSRT